MLLYSAPSSYFSMIARLALNEAMIHHEIRFMDIFIAKEQLSSWYMAINPSMTVPTLTDAARTWTDSGDILKFAAETAGQNWCDCEPNIVAAHYAIPIEKLTFGKIMVKNYALRKVFPIMLQRIIKQLETDLHTTTDPDATKRKISINLERLAYFTEDDQLVKLNEQREKVRDYFQQLPQTQTLLFGEKPSPADIVTAILFARLNMIGEYKLMNASPNLVNWFERMKVRPAFIKSDIWLRFKPWRILLKC